METATGNSRQTTTTSGKPTKATTAKATKPTTRAKPAGRAKPATGSKPATKATKPATRAGRAKPAKAATKPATTARTRTKPTAKPAAPPAEPTCGTDLAAGDPVRSTDPVVDPGGSSSLAESAAAGPVRMPDPAGPPQPADLATAGSVREPEPVDIAAEGGRVSWGLGKAAEAAGGGTGHDERGVRPSNGPVSRRARGPSEAGSLRFVAVARALSAVARREGWTSPAFRSPPGLVGVSRTIRRQRDGTATISVVLRGRPWAAVLADMVEGVVAANRLQGTAADRCRTALWRELREVGEEAA